MFSARRPSADQIGSSLCVSHHVNGPIPGKRSKKSSKPPTNLLWGITTNIAVGPLGFRAEVDINPKGEKLILPRAGSAGRADSTSILDESNHEPSRIVPCKRESGVQGPPVPGTSNSVTVGDIGPGDHPTSECWWSSPTLLIFILIPILCSSEENIGHIIRDDKPAVEPEGAH